LVPEEEDRLHVSSNEEEFRALYQRVFPLAFRVGCRFSGRRDDAEDAAQEALARAFQRWSRLRGQPWVCGWVLSTTLNILRTRRPFDVAEHEDAATLGGDVDASLDLWNAIRRLPKRQAQAVILYYLADLPVAHVASVMGCREGTAKAHLDRARKRLASVLGRPDASREEG
jgi:RNA polymerase sigma-70 factor (ECF subfamily)